MATKLTEYAHEYHAAGTCSRTIGPRGGTVETAEVWRVSGQPTPLRDRPYGTIIGYRLPVRRGLYESTAVHLSVDGTFESFASGHGGHIASICQSNVHNLPFDERPMRERGSRRNRV